jgi:hypothetical protein
MFAVLACSLSCKSYILLCLINLIYTGGISNGNCGGTSSHWWNYANFNKQRATAKVNYLSLSLFQLLIASHLTNKTKRYSKTKIKTRRCRIKKCLDIFASLFTMFPPFISMSLFVGSDMILKNRAVRNTTYRRHTPSMPDYMANTYFETNFDL